MHELALWVGHAAGDVSFVETSNASGRSRSSHEALVLSATTVEEPVEVHTGGRMRDGAQGSSGWFAAGATTCPY